MNLKINVVAKPISPNVIPDFKLDVKVLCIKNLEMQNPKVDVIITFLEKSISSFSNKLCFFKLRLTAY